MVFARIRQLVDRLSAKAIFNRLDKRKLQNELDTHRLYLVTSHFDRLKAGRVFGDSYVQDLAAEAQKLGHEGMQSATAAALQRQFVHISAAMHDYLRQAKDPMPAAVQATVAELRQKQHIDALSAPKSRRPRGLAAAVGASGSRLNSTPLASASQSTPCPASASCTVGSSSATQASEPPNTTTANQDQSEADVPGHGNNSRSHISSSASISSSSSSITTSDVRSSESSSSSHVSGRGSGSGSRKSVTMAQLGAVMLDQLGYSLEVRTSGIAHPDAGDGLWLRGAAPVGAVVGLYPGLVYEPMHYRKVPGYPKIDTHNDYFLARFDGALIDGQSWGQGRPTLGPSSQHVDLQYNNTRHAMLAQLRQKEMRHPLALAHYANHPAAGAQPNVMVAAFTYNPRQGSTLKYKSRLGMHQLMRRKTKDAGTEPDRETLDLTTAKIWTRLRLMPAHTNCLGRDKQSEPEPGIVPLQNPCTQSATGAHLFPHCIDVTS